LIRYYLKSYLELLLNKGRQIDSKRGVKEGRKRVGRGSLWKKV